MALFKSSRKKDSERVKAADSLTEMSQDTKEYVNGSVGEIKTFNVDDRTASIAMAIVAEQTDIPLNQLKFISIKEVVEK